MSDTLGFQPLQGIEKLNRPPVGCRDRPFASDCELKVSSEIQTGDCKRSNGTGYLIKVKSFLGTRNTHVFRSIVKKKTGLAYISAI
jgi:hypothetical protein